MLHKFGGDLRRHRKIKKPNRHQRLKLDPDEVSVCSIEDRLEEDEDIEQQQQEQQESKSNKIEDTMEDFEFL